MRIYYPEEEARLLVIQLILLFLSQEGLDLLIKCCDYAPEVREKKTLFLEMFWPRLQESRRDVLMEQSNCTSV